MIDRITTWATIAAWLLVLALIGLAVAGCETTAPVSALRKVKARVTFYNKHEDKFGSRIAMTSAFRACEGRTMAAPRVLPFNTRVMVPQLVGIVGDGKFNIEDRGGALESAYRHGQLRLDVYVASRAKFRRLKYEMSEYMEAIIE